MWCLLSASRELRLWAGMVDLVPRPADKPERSEGGQVGMAAWVRVVIAASSRRGSGSGVLGAGGGGAAAMWGRAEAGLGSSPSSFRMRRIGLVR